MKLALTLAALSIPALTACATAQDKPGFYKGYETPEYKVIKAYGDVELREYPPQLVAEVTVKGERKEAISEGFRILADFIFGGNLGESTVEMTSPVVQSRQLPSDKGASIAMTSPVVQNPDADGWVVQFSMPRAYTLETLPKPKDKRIALRMTEPRKILALRYSGWWSESNYEQAKSKLLTAIHDQKLKPSGDIGAMYYDDPFTLPWNRRNEVMVEVK